MKKITFVLCMIVFAIPMFAYEGSTLHDGSVVPTSKVVVDDCLDSPKYIPTPALINEAELTDPNDPTSNIIYNGPDLRKPEVIHASMINGPRWGTDVLVYNTEIGESQDMDVDEVTNDIYIAIDTYRSTGDSVFVCKSTDGGDTWQPFSLGTNTDGSIGNAKVRVARDGSGQSWVIFGGIWYEPSGARILWTRRLLTNGTGATFEQAVPDSVISFDLDADVGTGAAVYCAYYRELATYSSVWSTRNILGGAGWQNNQNIYADCYVTPYQAVASGAGGNAAISFIDTRATGNPEIRIKRSTDYGANWLGSEQVSNNGGSFPLTYSEIAYSHGTTQIGWIFATWDVSGSGEGLNLAYYYSTNSGVNWTYGDVVGFTVNDENMSTMRTSKLTGDMTLAYNSDPGDSTMFSWAMPSAPTSFSTPVRINDYLATSIWPPVAGWVFRGAGLWSAVTYGSSAMGYRPYFDWFGNVAVAERTESGFASGIVRLAPNPAKGNTRLSYTVKTGGNVRIALYDVTGQLVKDVFNYNRSPGVYSLNLNVNTAAGVYFVKVITADGVQSQKLVIVQ